ncbi:phage tail protein [Romboutsia sp. 1001216sp1]|uniref:phage tail spike protein n=1 Tax=Romboutsia sp. 1001216sp1 TaxID=2986997 RepID=UPI00232AE80C|nr:phage tail spike protein [Romboutsia sp. 1001216sp1]MDB8791701.1 phage tail protein [Romboutsia sp. 1001216sp1]
MICIYDKNSSKSDVINSNGIYTLDDICVYAEIKEVLNGTYEFDAEFKFDDNKKYKEILEERILRVDDVYGEQVFRISKTQKTQNTIKIYARNIFYDTNDLFLEDVRPDSKDGNLALDWIFKGTTTKHEFNCISNISTINTAYYIRKTVLEALMDSDNCFLKRWGGEIDRSIPYLVRINDRIGSNRGVEIRSNKNLLGFEEELDMDTVVTRVYPVGANGLMIDEKYVDSPLINNYATVKSLEVDFNNIKVKEEDTTPEETLTNADEGLTLEQAKTKLKEEALKLFSEQNIDKIKAKYLVDFVDLYETEEYKQFKMLERVWLGDTVSVYVDELDINIDVRVVERVYDVLAKRHKELKLSNYTESHKSDIDKVIDQIEGIITDKDNWLDEAKQNATDLITNGLKNSHVLVRKNEILIMDTPDPNTAVKVWRWNQGGLGYSSTGYNGDYGLAMTMDGAIVADFITVGKLKGEVIDARNLLVTKVDGTKTLEVDSNGDVSLNVKSLKIGTQSIEEALIDAKYSGHSEVDKIFKNVALALEDLRKTFNDVVDGTIPNSIKKTVLNNRRVSLENKIRQIDLIKKGMEYFENNYTLEQITNIIVGYIKVRYNPSINELLSILKDNKCLEFAYIQVCENKALQLELI